MSEKQTFGATQKVPLEIPFCGEIKEGVHQLMVRVYYADTDFSGVVYHGRYLEFFERGRSEFLRLADVHHHQLAKGEQDEALAFVVRHMDIDFKSPATIDDILCVKTSVETLSGARIHMVQSIMRDETVLTTARVEVALINKQGRPRRFPKEWQGRFLPNN